MREPFVLLENDFYLWEIPPESKLLNSELIVEDMHVTPDGYYKEISNMKSDGLNTRPRWYRFANKGEFKIPSKGIYGGTNITFINEHAAEVIKLTTNPENLSRFQVENANKSYKNTHLVYDLWYCGAKLDTHKIEPFNVRASDIKYTHLYSDKKNDPDVIIKLYQRVKKDLPDFMNSIKSKESSVFDPLSDYDYFIEPIKGIDNVPCGKKKLTFVMALMNRSHQIEQTLLKNLEDNWEDRADVEFLLMDVNSKDGFRNWIREQNLEKYIECGYLRYYETEILDQWHASIGKNTATHQARGTIVVTLDCDNFTGYRGGRFVITQFEQNDYNCVVHQYDWKPQNGNFGRIALTKKKFNEIGGYDQSLMPMGYQDWDLIKRAEASGCTYVNPTDEEFNRAIVNEGGKELSMANQTDVHKQMGWIEMNRINKLKCHINLYQKKHKANEGYYGIRSDVRNIYGEE